MTLVTSMRQVRETVGWGAVFRAIFTLTLVPKLTGGLPLPWNHPRTPTGSAQTLRPTNEHASPTTIFDRLRNSTTLVSPTWEDHQEKPPNRSDNEEYLESIIKSRTWPLSKEEDFEMAGLRQNWPRSSTNNLRSERTLHPKVGTDSVAQSQEERWHIENRTTMSLKTILPQRRTTIRSISSFWKRRESNEQVSANFFNNSVATFQGLNSSSYLSLNVNQSNNLDELNSTSESMSLSSWSSLSSSFVEDDFQVNRTNGTLDNRSIVAHHEFRNRTHSFNINDVLHMRKCNQNMSLSEERGNDMSLRSRKRRGVESEGCQVLHINHGYVSVDPEGLVSTTWDGDDIYTRLYIFSIGPGYSRIKGIAANRYIHMDEAGAVYAIPSSEVPEPYDAKNSKGAWYEAPVICRRSRWIQWYRKEGTRNDVRYYLAFNWQGRPMRTTRPRSNMCHASFMKMMSTGTSCNPNDGGYTNN